MSFRNLTKTFRYVNELNDSLTFVYENGFVINKPQGIDTLSISHNQAQGINQVGATIQSSNVQARPVTISGILVGAFQAQNKNRLLSVIRPDLSARLYADDYYLEVRPSSTPTVEPKPQFSKFQFQLLAAYPYWQKDDSASATLSGVAKRFKLWDKAKEIATGGNGRWWNISGGGGLHSYSGSIVSFQTEESTALNKLIADFIPIQSLNGQEAPYPSGGGKNKWSGDATFSKDNSATYTPQVITAIPAGTYTISGLFTTESAANKVRFSFRTTSPVNVSLAANSGSRTSATFTLAEDCTAVRVYGQDNTTDKYAATFTNVQVCLSTATDPEVYSPYSNICPISGHTGCDIFVKAEYDEQETPTESISFGQTVYGGKLTVNEDGSGQIDATMALVDLGDLNWTYSSNQRVVYSSGISSAVKRPSSASVVADIYCSALKPTESDSVAGSSSAIGIHTNGNIRVWFTGCPQTGGEFKQMAVGWKLVYELAEPITIPVTAEQINTLVGDNVVWIDGSNDISVSARSKNPTPYRFGEVISAQFININNDGQVSIPFKVTFKALAAVENPKLIDAATNKFLLLNKTLVAGEIVTIEITHERTYVNSSVDGECRGALDLQSSFFRLAVGDNVIKPEATSGKANLQVKLDFATEIVGVTV